MSDPPPYHSQDSVSDYDAPLRVGIISANWGAYAHLPAWRSVNGVDVTAICTSREETARAASERFGVSRAFWDAFSMIADPEIDIVDCGTRPNVRHPMVIAALAAGKHVYSGIPFATDFACARALRDASTSSTAVAVVDAFAQWIPAHRLLAEMVRDGYLGRPFGGTCKFHLSLFNQPRADFPFNWFAEAGQGVSAMRNLGSHALHLLTRIFGPVDEVVAHDGQVLNEWRFSETHVVRPATNDFADLLLRFDSGLVLQLQPSWSVVAGSGWSLEVFGSAGRIVVEAPLFPTTRDTALYAARLGESVLEQVDIPDRLYVSPGVSLDRTAEPQAAHPMGLMMQQMTRRIGGISIDLPDFRCAFEVERILEGARRSMESRGWIRLKYVD